MDAGTKASTNMKSARTESSTIRGTAVEGDAVQPTTLASVFSVLNQLLAIAVDRQARRLGPMSLLDPWRGMHLDVEDVKAVVGHSTHVDLGGGTWVAELIARPARADPKLARIGEWFALEDVDLAILVLVLAPELDLRYERIYAYLHDDVTRKRPTLDLLASLLGANADERARLLGRLRPNTPLNAILDFAGPAEAPLLARPLVLGAPWRNFLLDRDELDPALSRFARLLSPGPGGIDQTQAEPSVLAAVKDLARDAVAGKGNLRMILIGPHGAGKAALAAGLAHDLELRLLVIDVRDIASAPEVRDVLERARLGAGLLGALLYIHGAGSLAQRDPQLLRALVETLATSRAWFVLSLAAPLPQMHTAPLGARVLRIELPSVAASARLWGSVLARHAIVFDEKDIERLATRFRLSAAQIEQAVADIGLLLPRAEKRVSGVDLGAAARALCGEELARLAQRIHPEANFDALVATPETQAQLREICTRVANREMVRREWTRDCLHARNAGVTALFTGPSGTGKTLAAEVLAGELGYDLFRIDLSAIVSKYIGETEKNLDRVFAAAEYANAVLFFDEADALFGKRSEVKDAHDRYANIEIAYLLQKMEQFDGLAILATNLKQNLDEAFARRLTFSVNFAFPEAGERRRLWAALWPPHARRAEDVDFDWFAQEYQLSGGNIRNTVLAAVHLAAADGQAVSREHLLHATRREYQKLGKTIRHPEPADRRLA
jgi:AAA+ superfamily predicted ATPase